MADIPASDDAPETTPADATQPTDQPPTLGPEGEKALEAFKQRAREAERKAKAAEAELNKLREESMSDQEKAVAQAKAEGLSAGRAAMGAKLVAAEIRAHAAGRLNNEQLTTLLAGLNFAGFIDEAGEVDLTTVAAFVDGIAPAPISDGPVFPDLGQGTRQTIPSGGGDPLLRDLKRIAGIA